MRERERELAFCTAGSKQPASAPPAKRAALRADLSGDARATRGGAPAVSRSDGDENPGACDAGHAACGFVAAVRGGARRLRRVACPTGTRHRVRPEPRARPHASHARHRIGPRGARHASPEALRPAACCRPCRKRALSLSLSSRSIASAKHDETKDPCLLPGGVKRVLSINSLANPRLTTTRFRAPRVSRPRSHAFVIALRSPPSHSVRFVR